MKPAFLKLGAATLLLAVTASNCASIVSKTSYPVSIDSNPEGAHIRVIDKKGRLIYTGKTPTAVRLKSGAGFFNKAEYKVHFYAKGYSEKVIPVKFTINGWYFGNLIIGGFIGMVGMLIVDPATGAMWRIAKHSDAINETLEKSGSTTATPTLQIMDVNNVPDHLKGSLVRIK